MPVLCPFLSKHPGMPDFVHRPSNICTLFEERECKNILNNVPQFVPRVWGELDLYVQKYEYALHQKRSVQDYSY